MSVRLTSSGLQGDYGRAVYTIYFNGVGTTGTNYPIGSLIQLGVGESGSTAALTGRWSGFGSGFFTSSIISSVSSIRFTTGTSGTYQLVIIQRIS